MQWRVKEIQANGATGEERLGNTCAIAARKSRSFAGAVPVAS